MSEDDQITQIEDELRRSQFSKWDAEEYLIQRHRAKIAALEEPQRKWRARLRVAREIGDVWFALIGKLTVVGLSAVWFLTGQFPLY